MLRWFEQIIDPLKEPDRLEPPARLGAFIWHYARQAKWWFVFFFFNGALIAAVELMLFSFIGEIVDLLGTAEPAAIWQDYGGRFGWMLFVVVVLRVGAMVAGGVIEQQILVPGFFNLVRWQAHRHVAGQSYTFFQNDFAGRLATKVMQTGQAIGDFLINLMQSLWFFIVFAFSTFAIFLDLDWRLAGICGLWIIGYIGIGSVLIPKVRKAARRSADMRSVFNGRIVDAYTNIHTVKLFDIAGYEDAFARDGLVWMTEALRDLTRIITQVRMSLAVLNGTFMALSGYLCINLWQSGGISGRRDRPGSRIGAASQHHVGLDDVFDLQPVPRPWNDPGRHGDHRPIRTRSPTARARRRWVPDHGAIHFDHVRFHYSKEDGVIGDLSLSIRPGEKVGLVGRSGAGKSTLVNLLLRLFDVEGGRILIDGQNIADVTQDSLRAAIGMVTQDTALLHRSVRDNITYGAPDAGDEDVIEAAEMAEAHQFIGDLVDPKGRSGYDAHVGERGVKLSGGQRQRVAIARVLLKDAPILVLDEATSALDSEIEAAIQESLYRLMEGKTVIAIAHRLSTIAAMDRLVVMDKGAIVEQGTHDELIALGGIYADLLGAAVGRIPVRRRRGRRAWQSRDRRQKGAARSRIWLS